MIKNFQLVLVSTLILGGCTFPFSKPQVAGIQVNADPQASVYIDDKHVGETDYADSKLKPGEHLVKLSPLQGSRAPWETRIKLISGLTTVVKRTFGNSPQESSNYVVQLEKISNKKEAELSIVTTPENVIVRIDDQPKGFSPLVNVNAVPGNHKITLSAPGFRTENITITAVEGYRLLISAELGKALALQPSLTAPASPSASAVINDAPNGASPSALPKPTIKPIHDAPNGASPKPSPTAALSKPYVEILTTPTGWLRVRSEPNGLADNEVGRVNSGTSHPFIETNDTGWYKIEYAVGKQGWVAATYTKLVK